MKKSLLITWLVVISTNVFCSQNDTSGLVKLYRTDSPRFQLGMSDISESQMSLTQVYYSREKSDIDEKSSDYSEEKSNLLQHLRKHKKVNYAQSDSWPQETDDPLDLDYIPSQKSKRSFEKANAVSFIETVSTDIIQETDPNPLFSSPNKKLKLSLNKNYRDKTLNLIKNRDFLNKYKFFDNVENLVLTVGDLKDADKFKFPNLKELNVDISIKQAKSKKISNSKTKSLRQLTLDELFSEKNQRELRDRRSKKENKEVAENKLSGINNQRLTYQVLSDLLSKNPNLEGFSFQHNNCANLPAEIWELKKLKNLTLKMLGMTELSSQIQNLANLEMLNLSNNKIKTLPEEIGKLNNLKELNLVGNFLMEEFPDVMEQLPNLEQLHIDDRQSNLWKEQLQKLRETNKNLKIEIW